ncbi:MAG: nucleotidyltransferase family protein [Candidatus Thorarchaeota archaeon]|jgi:NDP-sugar pyrophosphorylase family protein
MADTLESIMNELKSRINSEDTSTKASQAEIEALIPNTVVVMPAGGKGTRIRTETQSEGVNKVMISIDGKESMIERTVREYASFGIDKFVVLTGFLAHEVEEHLGDGSRWGVEINYSEDPAGRKVGNAGAILHAVITAALDDRLAAIIHNPDDLIIGLDRPCGEVFLEGHIKGRKNGCIGTFVVVPESPFQYSGMIIKNGKVLDITKYPPISVPAHTGITVFEPEIYEYFHKLVSLERESSFENVVGPVLAKEGRLYAVNIPSENWIPVNDLKGIEKARAAMENSN